jgi:hypothetical protein
MDCAIAHHGDAQNPLTSKNSPPILRPVESTMPYQCNGRHKPEERPLNFPIFYSCSFSCPFFKKSGQA